MWLWWSTIMVMSGRTLWKTVDSWSNHHEQNGWILRANPTTMAVTVKTLPTIMKEWVCMCVGEEEWGWGGRGENLCSCQVNVRSVQLGPRQQPFWCEHVCQICFKCIQISLLTMRPLPLCWFRLRKISYSIPYISNSRPQQLLPLLLKTTCDCL